MSESYIKAEIVRPDQSYPEMFKQLFVEFFILAVRVLVIWWAFASWFPELGLTYWQLILPVYAVRCLILPMPFGRQLSK